MKKQTNRYPSECTTIIVGKELMEDGSMIAARSEDWDAMVAKNLEIFETTENGPEEFIAKETPFRCKLPKRRIGYTALSPYHLHGEWGSAGFNREGVGMSATESIFSSEKVLQYDPLVEDGLAENSVFNIVLPYITTAREGVERLGSLIEKHGIAEGFGISFIDEHEMWYLETASGHRWLATRIPEDKYFVSGNQSRFCDYDPKDKTNYLASEDLIDFAKEHHLYEGDFDFHEAYARDEKLDTTYSYPRVWYLQQMYTPSKEQDVTKNDFPVFLKSDKKLTLCDIKKGFRSHYNDTEHDPYLNCNPKEPWRPISIFRTTQTHILQRRPGLPKEIGQIEYMCEGMAALGIFLPLYEGIKSYPEAYRIGGGESCNKSAYWKFRHVQILGMTDYNRYAPVIQETYAQLEEEIAQRQREMEQEYLAIYKDRPLAAQDLLQRFSDGMLTRALEVTDELTERLFTLIALHIGETYEFHGA